jgi:preprotein translocase subunit YajC
VADSFLILAQAAGPSGAVNIVFILALFAIMYFVMIRPQQKQLKAHRELLSGLKKGDEVITQGGMIGRIHLVSEREVTLEVANGVRIRVLKSSVSGKLPAGGEAAAKTEEKKEEK